MESLWILFIGIFFLLLIGVPIAIAIGLSTLLYLFLSGLLPPQQIPRTLFQSLDSFPLLAIPFFILAGNIMGAGGIARRLIRLGESIVGGLPGGLAFVAIISCLFFGAISGSGPATVAAIGGLMIPIMRERGYGAEFSTAVVACAGSVGVLIPPSVPMIVYSVSANVSIAEMFLRGIVPGLLMAVVLMIPAYLTARKNGWSSDQSASFRTFLSALNEAKLVLTVPVIILGGIYSGIFTPTESAAVAAAYGLFIALFVYKEIGWKDLPSIFAGSAITSATIGLLIATASLFGQVLVLNQIPATISQLISEVAGNMFVFLLLVNIFLLIVGIFIEALAAIIILTPILLPTAVSFGIDPVHFGVIMIMNLAIGFITPPVGVNLFVASGVSKVRPEAIFISVVPFLLWMLLALLLVTYAPPLVQLLR